MKKVLYALGMIVGLLLSAGVAQAKSHDADDTWGEWWSVYDKETGVHLFDYCKCVEGAHECSPCEELVGVASRYGYEGPFVEVKAPHPLQQ